MHNEDEMNTYKSKLEEEFNLLLEKGEDIRYFLYLPHEYLSANIKLYLDEFLMNEAYSKIESDEAIINSFIVYKDSLITVKLEKKAQQIELLQRLLTYFENKQEFEKCMKVHELLKQIVI